MQNKDRKLQSPTQEPDYYLHLKETEDFATQLEPQENLVVLVTSSTIGRENRELGMLLMKKFFRAFTEQGGLGKIFIFLNNGVSLTCAGSPILDCLCELEKDGAEIFSCAVSLEYFQMRDLLCVGGVADPYKILDYLQKIPKVLYF